MLDLDKSDLRFFPDGKVLGVNKCVLDVRKIPDLDLFQMEPTGWVISEKLKQMLENEELTGMEFTCIADDFAGPGVESSAPRQPPRRRQEHPGRG